MAPWKLPVIVAALAVPIVAAFALGEGGAGLAAGALAAWVIVIVAVRQRPRGPLGSTPVRSTTRSVLLVVTCAVEEPAEVRRLAAEAQLGNGRDGADVLVLAPAKIGFLDRWASDIEGARQNAQRNLVATVAALAKAGIAAEARVGDEDVVQAIEDQLGSFEATEVVLVECGGGEDRSVAVSELESRLRPTFRHVMLDGG